MTNPTNNRDTLEILMSTMNRNSLSFLKDIFPENSTVSLKILVVNQAQQSAPLESTTNSVRVINSEETGLAKSRNLLLKHAQGSTCLLADDDIGYVPGFDQIILKAFESNPDADLITFMMVNSKGEPFRDYPNIKRHTEKTVGSANSVVIAFRRESLMKSELTFNENFGLGADFKTGDEYVFLRDALKAGLNIYFEPKVILSHPDQSSGGRIGEDSIIYASAALFYKYSGILGYLRLAKYLFMIYRTKAFKFSDLWPKYLVGLDGIKHYKSLLKNGLEIR